MGELEYEGILAAAALALTASIMARALRAWMHSRWLHGNLHVRVLTDRGVAVGWRGERPILIVRIRLEVPRGKGRRPLLYEEVRVGSVLRGGEEVVITLDRSLGEYVEILRALGRRAYMILETSEGPAYFYFDTNRVP